MTDTDAGWLEDLTQDAKCAKCQELMPRGYRHFAHYLSGGIDRYHVHCAQAKRIKARCLERRALRCQPMED